MYVFDALGNNIYEIESKGDFDTLAFSDFGYINSARENSLRVKDLKKEVLQNAKTLILEVTEECNLRCTYCVFDESYTSERNHSFGKLSIQDAKSAINDFHKRTDGKEAYVIFYGGEPLLEFGLIKEIVSHANTIGRGIFKYSLTTNGVSLTPDKFDFLISNKFLVTVSVDGPSKVHDKMRISKNKKGSHSIVENNISQLKNYCESFYELNVRVNCTIFDKSDIDAIDSYFENNRLFHRESLRFSPALQSEGEVDRYMSLLQNPDYGFDFSRQEAKL